MRMMYEPEYRADFVRFMAGREKARIEALEAAENERREGEIRKSLERVATGGDLRLSTL
jgi:hypothetical protein